MKLRLTAAALLSTTLTVLPALGGTASAATTATASGAYTDNYKASFNADPTVWESRTWLAMRSLSANGVGYTPASLPAAGGSYAAGDTGMSLRASDGGSATLTAATTSTNALGQGYFRTDANGDFGLLMQEKSRDALKTAPIHEVLSVVRGGVVVATLSADYTYDAAVFNATAPSLEYNGPGGRWYVNGVATRLNWETSAPSATDTTAPLLSSVTMPASTTSRTITIGLSASDNVAVAQARFANEDGIWSAWQTFATSMTWTLSSSTSSYKGVTAQVRDAAGNVSGSLYTRITYTAPTTPDTTAPVLSNVTVPATTTTRTITIGISASDNVGVAQVRFANEDGVWSAWRTFATTMSWTLSSSAGSYKGVTTQVRDAAGNSSGTLYRKVTCNCG